jgi:hypothetical protein
MIRKINWLLFAFLLNPLFGREAQANTINAVSCNTSDVQTAISSATEGDTVIIPAGTCTWTSGITISGKGIIVKGAGSGRIIAYDNGSTTLTVGTGTQTLTIAGYSPGFSSSSITNGQTLRIFENNNRDNYMQGTVTSLVGNVLTMNITSTGGSGSTHRWLIATIPSTVIINNSSTALFSITEDTSFNTGLSGIQFSVGTNHGCCASSDVSINYTSGGQAVLIHDNWMQQGTKTGVPSQSIISNTNRGVVWNCSFDGSSYNNSLMVPTGAWHFKVANPGTGQNAWIQPSYWGTADTTGQNNFYVETNDFHAFQATSDNDDNGRVVWRYNLMDHATFATHGADSSPYGERYFEYYNNKGNFNGYGDGTTFNMANGWIGFVRGGTFVAHDNNLPAISSQDFTKPDIEMTVYNLQLSAGPNPCWGAGTSGGALYHAPRQVGFGRVTGTGTDGLGRTNDSLTYVGDSEPAYVWNNNRTFTVSLSDYGGTACTNPDHSSNYIVLNRDYFIGTAKPSYTPYTYPHPLTQSLGSSGSGSSPTAPSNLAATVQ